MNDVETALARLRKAPEDQATWGDLLRGTWPFVIALCYRALPGARPRADAEDLAQEVYLKFAGYWRERRPPLEDSRSLFALLAVMVRHLAGDSARRQSRARRDVSREKGCPNPQPEARSHEGLEVDLRDLLDHVSLRLKPEERAVLALRLQDYEEAEIADKLGISTRTVERRLRELRRVFAPHLRPDTDDAPEGSVGK